MDNGFFGAIFPRLQSCLRRHCNKKLTENYELTQWRRGSRVVVAPWLEASVQLVLDDQDAVQVSVRGDGGGEDIAKKCFFFLEEILGVVDQVRERFCRTIAETLELISPQVLQEMSPGLSVEKRVLANLEDNEGSNLLNSSSHSASEVIAAFMDKGFQGSQAGEKTLLDLVCFGSNEVMRIIISTCKQRPL